MIVSPCTGVCAIDEASGLCRGCARTMDEIARWGGMSDGEKRAVLQILPERGRGTASRSGVVEG